MVAVLIAMLFFGLVHSLTAGSTKQWFRRRFGERAYHGLYRLFYNVFSLLTIAPALFLMVFYDNGIVWNIDLRWEPVLLAIQAVGGIGLIVSVLQIDSLRFAGIKQVMAYLSGAALPLPDEPLQTGGVYRLVRHPLYLFSLLALWPVTVMTSAYLGFCIGATLYFVIGSIIEERRMVEYYGDAYRAYRARVPWLIPFVRLPVVG